MASADVPGVRSLGPKEIIENYWLSRAQSTAFAHLRTTRYGALSTRTFGEGGQMDAVLSADTEAV
jgi:hypothetical protein